MVGSLFLANSLSIAAQGALGARILDVGYVAKIYDGANENLNFTVLNLGRRDLSGASLFFFKVYADSTIVVDEFSSPWQCGPGLRISHDITVTNLKGPDDYLMRAELYWKNQTISVLEDLREFKVLVVKLYVTNWSQSISTIQLGARTPSTLVVSFQNGGNDKMLSTSISLTDSSGLQVNPQTQSIGDLDAGETARANFSVSAPLTTSMGTHALAFEVSYSDFRGTSQTETVSATLTVTKLGASLELNASEAVKYSYPITVAARLLDTNGDPIKDQTIRFYVLSGSEQKEIGSNVTDPFGHARLVYSGILDVGDYQVKAYYEGSASHDSATMTMKITVVPIPTELLSSIPNSTIVGQSLNITAQLRDEKGNPIPGQMVDFYADTQKFGSSLTNEDGVASTLYIPGSKGSTQLRITYEGEGNFAGTKWSETLTIEPIRTTLTLFVQSFAIQGDHIVLKATIKDSAGTPIQSATLNFTVMAGNNRIGQTLMTDSEGSASLPFDVVSTDTIKIDVLYPGDPRYGESRASATIMVFNSLLLGGVVTAIIGASILGILGFMKFKLKLDPVSAIRGRFGRRLPQRPPTKPIVSAAVAGGIGHCTNCGSPMSESEAFCRTCGSRRERLATETDLEEKVYSYIVEHSGVISLRQAATDLGLTPDQVKEMAEKLKREGRLA
jgi:protocatechuate 3,4-dioxygenase beta subunit